MSMIILKDANEQDFLTLKDMNEHDYLKSMRINMIFLP